MSEEMILSGAFFDNSMPKWATDETLKRIGLDLKKDNTQSRKQHDKMIMLLGKIVQNSTKEEKTQRDVLKEIKTIAKEIKDSNKTNKELVKEVKKSNKLTSDGNKAASKTTTNSKGETVDTSEMEGYLLDANKRLEDIYKVVYESSNSLIQSMENRNKMIGRSSQAAASKSQTSDTTREKSSGIEALIGDTLESITEKSGRRSRRGTGITNEISSSKGVVKRFNGRIMKMLSAIGSFVGGIKKFGGMIFDLIKKIPLIGTKIAAATAAMGAALDLANIINEHYEEYKTMMDAGMYIARTNVEQARMDGIMVRKMIGEVGLTVLAGVESMRENISAVNEIGLKRYFETIDDVMGDAQNAASFANKMMMNQGQIADFTGRFLKTLKSVSDLERLNSLERTKSVQTFIRSTRTFSQLTGKSMEHITKLMEQSQADPRVTTKLAGIRDEDQRANARQIVSNMAAVIGDTNNPIYQAFATAFTDATGAGVAANRELLNPMLRASHVLFGDDSLINNINEIAELAKQGKREDANEKMVEMTQQIQNAYNNLSEEQAKGLTIFTDGNFTNMISGLLSVSSNMMNNSEEVKRILKDNGEVTKQATETAQLAQQTALTKQQTEAAMEYAVASTAGSSMFRESMKMGYELMISTNDITEKGARAAVSSAHTLMENLPNIRRDVYDILSFLDDDRKSREEIADDALTSIDLGATAKAQREEVRKQLLNSGMSVNNPDMPGGRSMPALNNKFEANLEKFEKYGLSLDELIKQAKGTHEKESMNTPQNAAMARDMLLYMGSNQMQGVLSKEDRKSYKDALYDALEDMPDDQKQAFLGQVDFKLRSGSVGKMIQAKIQQETGKNNGSNNIESQTSGNDGSEIKSASEEAAKKAARDAEESAERSSQEANRNDSRRNRNTNTGLNQNGVPETIARPDNAVDIQQNGGNVMNILNENLSLLNSKVDDLIGVTKMGSDGTNNKLSEINNNVKNSGGSLGS